MSREPQARVRAFASARAPGPGGAPPGPEERWRVRPAAYEDIDAIIEAVRELLLELDGTPPPAAAMRAVTRAIIDSPWLGAVFVAEAERQLVGVLAASWQTAIHVPGAYALIQDLWVHPDWRSQTVGAGLLAALLELAQSKSLQRVEVGLPRESFSRFPATEAFYLANGFTHNGPRMKRALP